MIIKTYTVPPIENNNYVIADEETREAALIDCSSPEIWEKVLINDNKLNVSTSGENRGEIENIKLKYILLTHGHFDHIGGLRPDINLPVFMHKGDENWIKNVNTYMPMMGLPQISVPKIDKFLEDGEMIKLGNKEIKVLHTPGHTQAGVCYYVDGNLFSGDTIFRESVGRCDMEGGDFTQIVESIKNKIFTLPEDTKIYPGHGKPSTVGWEKEHNFFM